MHYKLVYKKYLLKATKLGHKGKSLMRTDWCGAFFYFILKGHKNLYRKRIKVRWCRDSILQKKFWKYIPHPCISTHTCAHPRTPVHTRAHLRTPAHTRAHPCTPSHTRTDPCTHSRTPPHTRAHYPTLSHTLPPPHILAHTPHIPTDVRWCP